MNEIFTIGDFSFRLICPDEITPPENFMKFRSCAEAEYTYTIELADKFPEADGTVIARREDLLVIQGAHGECRYIGVKGRMAPYACYQECGADSARILVDPAELVDLNIDPVFVSLLALERHLTKHQAMIFHCAYMEYQGGAVLFSAPSGTGKTTQAELWKNHRGNQTVNGDRALLQRIDGVWCARGWPVCGTSAVCHNQDLPIRAIVMLSQAREDMVRRLSKMQAFTQVYSQVTVNRWDREAALQAMALVEHLICEVPVLHLECTMNVTAVEALEQELSE